MYGYITKLCLLCPHESSWQVGPNAYKIMFYVFKTSIYVTWPLYPEFEDESWCRSVLVLSWIWPTWKHLYLDSDQCHYMRSGQRLCSAGTLAWCVVTLERRCGPVDLRSWTDSGLTDGLKGIRVCMPRVVTVTLSQLVFEFS